MHTYTMMVTSITVHLLLKVRSRYINEKEKKDSENEINKLDIKSRPISSLSKGSLVWAATSTIYTSEYTELTFRDMNDRTDGNDSPKNEQEKKSL